MSRLDGLLMITQVIDENDSVFGATLDWVEEFSTITESLHVIALETGTWKLPENVSVYSLGKEERQSRLLYLRRLYYYCWRLLPEVEGLLVHQGQIYVLLLAPLFQFFGKPVVIWKTHGHIPWTMKIGLPFVDRVITASEESFPVDTPKKTVTGHGINLRCFSPSPSAREPFDRNTIKLITVGRVSPTKRIRSMIQLVTLAQEQLPADFHLTIVGEPSTPQDEQYQAEIRSDLSPAQRERVHWEGFVPYEEVPSILEKHDLFLNFSETGSIDKAVLEAMAVQRPVLTSNPAFSNVETLRGYPYHTPSDDPEDSYKKLSQWLNLSCEKIEEYQSVGREWVKKNHSLKSLRNQLREVFSTLQEAK